MVRGDNTVRELFRLFGPARKGRRRMAFDVSHNAESQRYPNTQSFHNVAEHDRVLHLVGRMLMYTPQDKQS